MAGERSVLKSKYEVGLGKRRANHTPLSPVSLIRRTARVYPDHPAVHYGAANRTWGETYRRSASLAGALRSRGAGTATTVAALLPNTPAAVELAFGVPMSGAVLNMINTRLDPAGVAFILDHGEAEFLFIDSGLAEIAIQALALAAAKPVLIHVHDPAAPGEMPPGAVEYESLLADAEPMRDADMAPDDEWDAIALNYTSGTTGNPKGVVYHHRGAYLNALANALEWTLPHHPRYLWTLPMFHCNGWCFPWTLAAMAGTNICMRAPTAEGMLAAIDEAGVTHLCGAPIVLNMATTEAENRGIALDSPVEVMTAGAAPPAAVLKRAEAVGFRITHVYGLTEVYGPAAVCAWKPDWDDLPAVERAALKARQGVNYTVLEELSVRDPETLEPVRPDGEHMGEVMFRGNVVMKGYLKNDAATREAFAGGHFRSGDLAVMHPDGYIQLRDRSKDIIITGGENVSSIEVESVLYQHPAVGEAAVVAAPDEHWGETPAAFVELKEGEAATTTDLIEFCRERLAHFKCPRIVVFRELPKTSTGKIQKFVIREWAAEIETGGRRRLSG